ncbi:acyltransferase family protein [Herbaspirillum sp. alder98]|uniref:acyltransferase family protein n=1 Tax=Herbaspirillum sp. alder98 TaxID=2913096 RepID=UPI001CD8318A|nr:acyltransferase family protein [Herbaspirillum sp. alder98]MCA1324565.1 acyltransferase family protein [Herbaspirillum sp. alder98]
MQRQQWIDVLRGIGIVLVVWGHVYGGYSFDLIFLFHMPLFFFLSGMLFKPVDDVGAFARIKARQLLVPYTVFLLLINLPLGLHLLAQPHDPGALRDFVIDLLLGGSRLSAWVAAFWFVTSFYAVLLIEACLIGRYSQRTLLWLHALMLALSALNAWLLPQWQVPWALNVALAAAPFVYAGHLWHQGGDQPHLERWALALVLLALPVILLNRFLGWNIGFGYDMKVTHYGIPVVSFVVALACCVVMARFARTLAARHARPARLLAALGRAAIVIMFMHMVFTMGLGALVGEQYQLARVALGLGGSYLIYVVARRWAWSRRLLLGDIKNHQI